MNLARAFHRRRHGIAGSSGSLGISGHDAPSPTASDGEFGAFFRQLASAPTVDGGDVDAFVAAVDRFGGIVVSGGGSMESWNAAQEAQKRLDRTFSDDYSRVMLGQSASILSDAGRTIMERKPAPSPSTNMPALVGANNAMSVGVLVAVGVGLWLLFK